MIALRYSQPTLWNDQPMILEGWRKGIWGVWMNQSLNSSNANGLTIKVQSNFWWSPFLWLALPPRDFTKASQKRNPRRICQNFHSTLKSTAIEDKSDCISKTEKQDTLTLFRQDREFVLKNRIFSIDRSREYTYFCLSSPAHFIFFSPRSIVLFQKDGKSSLGRCEIVSVGDLGRPSRSSGPPHHSRAEDEAVDTYVNRVTTTTTTTTITLLKQNVIGSLLIVSCTLV